MGPLERTPGEEPTEAPPPRRPVFAPRPELGVPAAVSSRRLRRQRRERRMWYVLFSVPTVMLIGMIAWSLLKPGPPPPPRLRSSVEVEATVKNVDPEAASVLLTSEMLGMFGITLFVTTDTKIELEEGKPGSLLDLQEGIHVRTTYDVRQGRKVASRISVVPKDQVGVPPEDRLGKDGARRPPRDPR